MKLDIGRTRRQDGILDKWEDRGRVGTLEAATGFGKTYTAIRGIKRLRKNGYNKKIVIVTPTLYLQNQWGEKIVENGISNVDVWVVNSLVKRKRIKCGLLIPDEIHMYTAEVHSRIFDCVDYQFVLGLTATLDKDDERNEIIFEKAPVIDVVTLKECLEEGWVAPFTVLNYGINLSTAEHEKYHALNREYHRFFSFFGHDFRLAMACLTDKEKAKQHAKRRNWDYQEMRAYAVNWRRNMADRKKLLYNSQTKLEEVYRIVNAFPEKLIISFSQSTDFADNLTALVGPKAMSYHSYVEGRHIEGEYYSKKSMKEKAILDFADPDTPVRLLSTARALDMGADIPAIDMALVVSGSSKTLQALQRYGRAIRKHGNKKAYIIEIYAKKTQDYKWLKKRQAKTPKSSIKTVSSLEEIQEIVGQNLPAKAFA